MIGVTSRRVSATSLQKEAKQAISGPNLALSSSQESYTRQEANIPGRHMLNKVSHLISQAGSPTYFVPLLTYTIRLSKKSKTLFYQSLSILLAGTRLE